MGKSTTPIFKDKNGIRIKDSVAYIRSIYIQGNKQWILVRGRSINKPILLFLHGGPGVTTIGFIRKLQKQLEQHFICVNWDQRGAGKSYDKKVFNDQLTINDFVEDIHVLTRYLVEKYNTQKIILVGSSWGSIIGSMAAQRYPELFHAYIGIGQVVNMMEGERISYEFALESAKNESNEEAITELESIGFSPSENFKYLLIQRKWLKHYGGVFRDQKLLDLIFNKYLTNSYEYKKSDMMKLTKGNIESHKYLWDQMLKVNFLDNLTTFSLPTYYCVGRYDYNTPSSLMEKYYEVIQSPKKDIFWFEESAHGINFEEPKKFLEICLRIKKECEII